MFGNGQIQMCILHLLCYFFLSTLAVFPRVLIVLEWKSEEFENKELSLLTRQNCDKLTFFQIKILILSNYFTLKWYKFLYFIEYIWILIGKNVNWFGLETHSEDSDDGEKRHSRTHQKYT